MLVVQASRLHFPGQARRLHHKEYTKLFSAGPETCATSSCARLEGWHDYVGYEADDPDPIGRRCPGERLRRRGGGRCGRGRFAEALKCPRRVGSRSGLRSDLHAGAGDLGRTAIFIGGSDVAAAETLLEAVRRTFLGPMRVSVMIDPAGANTTAAAAVLAAGRHVRLSQSKALVLAATGPVGRRVVQLLAGQGAEVRAASRKEDRARAVCEAVAARIPSARLSPWRAASPEETAAALQGCQVVIAAGARAPCSCLLRFAVGPTVCRWPSI